MSGLIVTLDADGRVALSAEQRRSLGVTAGDMVEFWVAENRLVLRRSTPVAVDSRDAPESERTAQADYGKLAALTTSLR